MLDGWSSLRSQDAHVGATMRLCSVLEDNNNKVETLLGLAEGESVLGTIWRVCNKIDLLPPDKHCSLLRTGLPVTEPTGLMVVDIGGGTTDLLAA